LAWKGTLPAAYRWSTRHDLLAANLPASTHHHPLYVNMLKGGIPSMAGNGQQGHVGGHDNMFNNNRGGFGGNPGGGGGGPYFGDGKGQTRGEGGAVETFWPSYAAGIWRIQHEQWVVPSVRPRRQRQLPRCIWAPRTTPSSASRSEWFQPQCVGLLSALIETCSMVDSLVLDSI
jgi:hypothetical protein